MNEKFEHWALVEIMGHLRLAGRVTEQAIGGANFVRVDIPAVGDQQPFTRLFGASAIYSITLVDEETARLVAAQYRAAPMDEWSARRFLQSLPAPESSAAADSMDF